MILRDEGAGCGQFGVMSAPTACEHCGRSDAGPVADQWLCLDCYSASGACCAGEDGPDSKVASVSGEPS